PGEDQEPGEGEETPEEDQEPGEGEETPGEDQEPGEGEDTPGEDQEPGEGEETPEEDQEPGEGEETPGEDQEPGEETSNKVNLPSEMFDYLGEKGISTINLTQIAATDITVNVAKEQLAKLIKENKDLQIENHSVALSIPHALLKDVTNEISVNVKKMATIDSAKSDVYDFTIMIDGKVKHQFDTPITLTFVVNTENVKDTNLLKVFYWNEDTEKWELIGGEYRDGKVIATTNHFSTFAVFETSVNEEDHTEQPQPVDEGNKEENNTGKEMLPNTATSMFNWLAFGALLLLFGLIIGMVRYRKN
ncbi:LPXTG cell wall anchor domain-containing protein, partial [Gracilibacillus marinus]